MAARQFGERRKLFAVTRDHPVEGRITGMIGEQDIVADQQRRRREPGQASARQRMVDPLAALLRIRMIARILRIEHDQVERFGADGEIGFTGGDDYIDVGGEAVGAKIGPCNIAAGFIRIDQRHSSAGRDDRRDRPMRPIAVIRAQEDRVARRSDVGDRRQQQAFLRIDECPERAVRVAGHHPFGPLQPQHVAACRRQNASAVQIRQDVHRIGTRVARKPLHEGQVRSGDAGGLKIFRARLDEAHEFGTGDAVGAKRPIQW